MYFMHIHVTTYLRQSALVIDDIHPGRSCNCADVGVFPRNFKMEVRRKNHDEKPTRITIMRHCKRTRAYLITTRKYNLPWAIVLVVKPQLSHC